MVGPTAMPDVYLLVRYEPSKVTEMSIITIIDIKVTVMAIADNHSSS